MNLKNYTDLTFYHKFLMSSELIQGGVAPVWTDFVKIFLENWEVDNFSSTNVLFVN